MKCFIKEIKSDHVCTASDDEKDCNDDDYDDDDEEVDDEGDGNYSKMINFYDTHYVPKK